MKRLLNRYKRIRDVFLEGPDWFDLPAHMTTIRGYRPVSVVAILWIYGIYERCLTAPGRMLITVFLAVGLYSAILIRSPVLALLFALFSILLTDFIAGLLLRPSLRISRTAPERVKAGAQFRIHYTIRNKRRIPAWDVILDYNLPFKNLRRCGDAASSRHVPTNSEITLESSFIAFRRGQLKLRRPMAESSFPFNVFRWTCRDGERQSVIVHPSYHMLESLDIPTGRRLQRQSMAAVSKVGESMDFHGCREFRSGDDPRRIHWLGSARRVELVVKEFQEERLSRVALILDTFIPKERHLDKFLNSLTPSTDAQASSFRFEAAVSLAASLSEFLSRGEFIIDIFAAGPQIYHFQGGRSLAHLDDMLDILSCIEPSETEPFDKLSPELMEEMASIGAAYLLLLRADERAEALSRQLKDSGTELRTIMVSDAPAHPEWIQSSIQPEAIMAGRALRL